MRRRHFPEHEQRAFLDRAAELRRACIAAQARAPINEPFYCSLSVLMAAIDGVAEAVTGDPRHLHAKAHSPGPSMWPP